MKIVHCVCPSTIWRLLYIFNQVNRVFVCKVYTVCLLHVAWVHSESAKVETAQIQTQHPTPSAQYKLHKHWPAWACCSCWAGCSGSCGWRGPGWYAGTYSSTIRKWDISYWWPVYRNISQGQNAVTFYSNVRKPTVFKYVFINSMLCLHVLFFQGIVFLSHQYFTVIFHNFWKTNNFRPSLLHLKKFVCVYESSSLCWLCCLESARQEMH